MVRLHNSSANAPCVELDTTRLSSSYVKCVRVLQRLKKEKGGMRVYNLEGLIVKDREGEGKKVKPKQNHRRKRQNNASSSCCNNRHTRVCHPLPPLPLPSHARV